MVDHEKQVYTLVTNILQEKFETIQITNQKLYFYHSTYPAISLVQTDNYVMKESLSFDKEEFMSVEEYTIEVQSNQDMDEIKNIIYAIDTVMNQLGYIRIYCGLDTEDKEVALKRVIKYQTRL